MINSHTLYEVKQKDDGFLRLKARIAPRGHEDNLKHTLRKYCATCPPTGLPVSESIAPLFDWTLYSADVKAASLQTDATERHAYVKPSVESCMRATHVLSLLTRAYGLVKTNGRWQPK